MKFESQDLQEPRDTQPRSLRATKYNSQELCHDLQNLWNKRSENCNSQEHQEPRNPSSKISKSHELQAPRSLRATKSKRQDLQEPRNPSAKIFKSHEIQKLRQEEDKTSPETDLNDKDLLINMH
ncbi:hypothetical protein BgiMline_009350 [Biomphalaria glabrata]|nr:hypothetical protein BgiMline_023481 [Biomphalaria glabrata]KAI8784943.1 hypothetical protein BgiBS90_014470 [Biomphalaria glabrata]